MRKWMFKQTMGSKNPKTLLSARTDWAGPLHQRSSDQSVLRVRNAILWNFSFPTRELAAICFDSQSLKEQTFAVCMSCVCQTL